MMGNR